MKLAIHSDFWPPEEHAGFSALAEVAAAGYFGFVQDARRVDLARPEALYRWASHYALNVVALDARSWPGDVPVEPVAVYASEVLAPFVTVGDMPGGARSAERLNALGAICRAHDVRLCYQPSAFTPGLRRLAAQSEPALVSFALDVAWLEQGYEEWLPRAGYLVVRHALAAGPLPARPALPAALGTRDLWLVVEPAAAA